jgi:hypothetical protein
MNEHKKCYVYINNNTIYLMYSKVYNSSSFKHVHVIFIIDYQ